MKNTTRHFMTKKERQVKEEIITLLRNRRHAKYAARLEMLDLNIVPLAVDPTYTAAISFEEGTVFISEGFLNGDRAVFEQLDMVMRHELAHNLLMHQVRMMHKLGDETYLHTRFSKMLHHLWNIIEDDEISNTRYSPADKILARNLMINGRTIRGLVTEDHRAGWTELSIEEMYEELKKEADEARRVIQANPWLKNHGLSDMIQDELYKTAQKYADITSPSKIKRTMTSFMNTQTYSRYPSHIKKMIKSLCDTFPEDKINQAEMQNILTDIANSTAMEKVDITKDGNTIASLYTPEEKWLVLQVLKNLSGNIDFNAKAPAKVTKAYKKQYNNTIVALDKESVSNEQLAAILKQLEEKSGRTVREF